MNFSLNMSPLLLAGVSTLVLLSACSPSPEPEGSPGPSLTVEPIKQFRFDWPASDDATHYRILENPDGRSGFTNVSGDIPAGTESFVMEVALHARVNAEYILQRCNSDGCSDSRTTSVSGNLATGVGYFKPDVLVPFEYHFGQAVALSGDGKTLAVAGGDYLHIFVEATPGQWQQQEKISLREPASALAFSTDGNRLAVGSRTDNSSATGIHASQSGVSGSGASLSGAVYVFSRSGTSWSEQAYIKASNTAGYTYFGNAIDLSADGNRLVVGSYSEDNDARGINDFPTASDVSGQPDSGAAYVYRYNGSEWIEDAYLKASNAHDAWFGRSVGLSGDGARLVVGAMQEDNDATGVSASFPGAGETANEPNSGAAYVYYHDGSGWTEEAYIKASNAKQLALFGASVSLDEDGNVLAVGAKDEETNLVGVHQQPSSGTSPNRYYSGAVYLYARTGSSWSEQAFIKAGNADNNDHFGIGVRLSGDGQWLAVVAKEESGVAAGVHGASGSQHDNSAGGSGAVYIYRHDNSLWTEQAYVKPSNTRIGDGGFGYHTQPSVDLSADGERLVVGMWAQSGLTTGIQSDQSDRSGDEIGAAYLY